MNPPFRRIRANACVLLLGLLLAPSILISADSANKTPNPARPIVPKTALAQPPAAETAAPTSTHPDLIIIQAPIETPGTLSRRFPQGSKMVRLSPFDSAPHSLTSDFFAAADPRISSDGARVLFSGKKTTDAPWQIWEMDVDGTGPRQVTHCASDCLEPAYLARGLFAYTALPGRSNMPTSSSSKIEEGSQIWVGNLEDSEAAPITFGPGDYQVETVLKNGTILATARTPLLPANGRSADRELYTLRFDGTALSTLRCDHQHPAVRKQAKELDDGSIVFVKDSASYPSVGGQLTWIRRGAVHNEPLTAPTILTSSPQPMAGEQLLVTRESPTSPGKVKSSTVYSFDAASGKFGTATYADPKLVAVEAIPVAAHEVPVWYWSTLNPDLKRGYFICLDAHLAQEFPGGRIAAGLARIRVLTLDNATGHESVLGEAPVEADGSFYIAVPPDQPVRFELLDAAGHVVRAQKSWIWTRSGEEHGCVGCHEDRALAPENRWPMALQRFDSPTRLDLAKK